MKFFDKVKFHAWDSVALVAEKLKDWKPKKCSTEKDYENSLYKYLHDELGDIQVTKQYAQGRIRADLMIGDKVIVELKHNLDTTAKYQRLIGQLSEYKEWKGRIIILLTGETDKNIRKQLDEFVRKEGLGGDAISLMTQEAKVTIFDK